MGSHVHDQAHTSVVAKVEGVNRVSTSSKPLNKLNAEVGTKLMVYTTHIHLENADAVSLAEGEEVSCSWEATLTQITLMDFATAVVRSLVTAPSPQGTVVKGLTLALNPDGNPKSTSKRFHWLPAAAPPALAGGALTPVVLVKYPRPTVSVATLAALIQEHRTIRGAHACPRLPSGQKHEEGRHPPV